MEPQDFEPTTGAHGIIALMLLIAISMSGMIVFMLAKAYPPAKIERPASQAR